jgi:hypothetical protein
MSSITVFRVIFMPVTLRIRPKAINPATPISSRHVPATIRKAAHSQMCRATSP